MQQASKEPADSTMRFCLCDENIEINENFPDKIKDQGLFDFGWAAWSKLFGHSCVLFLTVDNFIYVKVSVVQPNVYL